MKAAAEISDPRFTIVHGAFGTLADELAGLGIGRVHGILLDLGVSSPQLDDAERGFSFRHDAPLDMRMDTTQGRTAAEWLATATESEIREVIKNYGEERFAKQIAAAIVAARARGSLGTTRQLAALVAEAVPTREPRQDPATRTFQALRIHVNQELEELSLALPQCVELLEPGGRLVGDQLSLARGPHRQAFPARALARRHAAAAARRCARATCRSRSCASSARRGGLPPAEVAANPRARSAIMRVAERVAT